MAAAWWRARPWRLKVTSSTTHGGNSGEDDDTASSTTAFGTTTTTTGTTTSSVSGPVVRQPSFDDFFHHALTALVEEIGEEERLKKLKLEYIKTLVVRFQSDDSAPERWLLDLEVAWVHQAQASESGRSFISRQVLYLARSWILALFEITKSISIYFGGSCSEEDGPPAAAEFIRFVEATLSKMLPFVDAVVAVRTSAGPNDRRGGVKEPADEKLQALILLRDALSTASVQILSSCTDFNGETRDLLSAELLMAKLDEATWSTMEEAKAGFVSSWWGTGTPRSSDVHVITRSFISYIKVLRANEGSLNHILHDAFLRGEFVPDNENGTYLTNLTIEMVHSLEEKLTTKSQSFTDQSLKFLFLINNFRFVLQQLSPLGFPILELSSKIDDCVDNYTQVSWAPVLKCLHNPTPHCFARRSPLPKFESKFQKTFTAQKLWKVPDPEMRKRMRDAVVDEVIPGFTEFLKDNTTSTPRITPQVMKKMLEELFEG